MQLTYEINIQEKAKSVRIGGGGGKRGVLAPSSPRSMHSYKKWGSWAR